VPSVNLKLAKKGCKVVGRMFVTGRRKREIKKTFNMMVVS